MYVDFPLTANENTTLNMRIKLSDQTKNMFNKEMWG